MTLGERIAALAGKVSLRLGRTGVTPTATAKSENRKPTVDRCAAAIDAGLMALHGERRRALGDAESGLFSHYATLMERGTILVNDDIAACRLVQVSLPPFREYVVLRAGLGELAFLLNGVGLQVVACEPNGSRFAALEAGLERLAASGTVDPGAFRTFQGYFPARIELRPTLAVAPVFVFDLPLEEDQEFCRALQRFDALLINPRLFIRVRESESERLAASEFLRSLGFEPAQEFIDRNMIYFERAGGAATASAGVTEAVAPLADVEQSAVVKRSLDEEYTVLIRRLMALVPPPATPSTSGTTWVVRPGRGSDLGSASRDKG